MFDKVVKFSRLSWNDQGLLIESSIWLGIARLALLAVPFRFLVSYFGQPVVEPPKSGTPEEKDGLRRIAWAVLTMSCHLPWECNCFAQAIAGRSMLKIRGLHSILYLGVAKDKEKGIVGHAWLRSGSVILTGAQGKDKYTVVSTFAEKATFY